jgi:signal transduction histidine kinase
VGSFFGLSTHHAAALASGRTDADVSDLGEPENQYEKPGRKLLEVYTPVKGPAGDPLLFEAYLTFSSVSSSGERTWEMFLPALIAGLVVLELVQLPLAYRLARKVQRSQRDRVALLRQAVEASDVERRRIASELHDSIVQEMAGQSLALAASARRLAPSAPPEAVEALRSAAQSARRSHQQLRSMLFDIYPPNLRAAGLESALCDLLSPLSARGVNTSVAVSPELVLAQGTQALIYRAAREAIRNALKHAEPKTVSVRVEPAGKKSAVLVVQDDGRGFAPAEAASRSTRGHVGLQVLGDLARSAGGSFTIDSAPGQGTSIRLEVPR